MTSLGSKSSAKRPEKLDVPEAYIYAMKESPFVSRVEETNAERQRRVHIQIILRVLQQVRFIAEHFREVEAESQISDDWTFVAMVVDRLFLVIFAILNVATLWIILEAPSLYDTREPLNITAPIKPLGQGNLFGLNDKYL
uniref:Neurotransmitter-gated ion-channel transmembrane domain-containing protein n=1 Tax=Plectus sambesii TaxID=2011161 RepID=A0A914WSH6_9BILA